MSKTRARSKSNKRSGRSRITPPVQAQAIDQSVRPATSALKTAAASAVKTNIPSASSLREEYRYVLSDLKRIGIVAASMFAILVVLALIIT